jgi:hypothetical protein
VKKRKSNGVLLFDEGFSQFSVKSVIFIILNRSNLFKDGWG